MLMCEFPRTRRLLTLKMAARALSRELKRVKREDPATGIGGGPRGEDLFHWDAFIIGPAGTPWEGGKYRLTFSFPERYRYRPPVVRFVSRMFHPNIYPDGSICVDMLDDKDWSPAMNVRLILLSLQSLLDSPNTESPANPEAAQLYCTNRRAYNRRVRAIAEDCSE